MAIEIKNMQLSSKISHVNDTNDIGKSSDVNNVLKTDCCNQATNQDKSLQRHSKHIARIFEAHRER